MTSILDLVNYGRKNDCSDIHLSSKLPPVFRKNGQLYQSSFEHNPQIIEELILSILTPEKQALLKSGTDLDFCYVTPEGLRQRVNIYRQQESYAAAIRLLNDTIPSFENLKLPPIMRKLANEPRGLILITGPTGSGKSTTLAAMIDYINLNKAVHILTIEDPVEYRHEHKKSLVHQREVGVDVPSFASALRSSLREDPDVILVGEMRDFETISAAVTAAETGHLVLSTLHTIGAANTIDRIIDVFPPHSQQQIRTQLSSVLKGVVTQQLVPLANGEGRMAALEVLIGTDAVLNLIRDSKTHQLASVMQTGGRDGMKTLNADLARLVRDQQISYDVGLDWASDKQEFNQYFGK
ncbi:PilT/PilU family type 4a pilus ATPase [Acetobacterium fimetarium]|uniref:PilT/PilU family type 4a pilus ATPase n=1 Tax=Acetobacterium fimetarium TaxID=52691 RepID=A0ABR6WUZ1_9FIRM|nr:type IV pilus twitching motility protein PilT [Acetobacterium fimetarium]MBC3804438.1 PilT/PilU family type 4a pilus ATPase [Acetobacterium fimetarium]